MNYRMRYDIVGAFYEGVQDNIKYFIVNTGLHYEVIQDITIYNNLKWDNTIKYQGLTLVDTGEIEKFVLDKNIPLYKIPLLKTDIKYVDIATDKIIKGVEDLEILLESYGATYISSAIMKFNLQVFRANKKDCKQGIYSNLLEESGLNLSQVKLEGYFTDTNVLVTFLCRKFEGYNNLRMVYGMAGRWCIKKIESRFDRALLSDADYRYMLGLLRVILTDEY